MQKLEDFLSDLRLLQEIKDLSIERRGELKNSLITRHAIDYVDSFTMQGKPEVKLSTFLFGPLITDEDYLNLRINPEIKAQNGWVDYFVESRSSGNPVAIELKPLHKVYSGKIRINSLKDELEKIRKSDDSDNQIKKYLSICEYVLLTNLKEVYYFHRDFGIEFSPFDESSFIEFVNDLKKNNNIWDVVRKRHDRMPQRDLDKKFFKDLKDWYNRFSNLKFKIGTIKGEKIVQILNKLIFLKTLEDFNLIPFNKIIDTYKHARDTWGPKGDWLVFDEFFGTLNKFAYLYYDTELFRDNTFDDVVHDKSNLVILSQAIEDVLGLSTWDRHLGYGLLSYNYRKIDEDIFGKAYETFLAEERSEKGIFYTQSVITNHMSRAMVEKLFSEPKERLIKSTYRTSFDYELAKKAAEDLNSIKIADLAGGSGSFMIKTLRHIWSVYKELDANTMWTTEISIDERDKDYARIQDEGRKIRKLLGIGEHSIDVRRTLSRVILKHLYCIDLDSKAMDVAKVNIWKEAVKIEPKAFHYKSLSENISHVLPTLDLNFIIANSLIGLPIKDSIEIINTRFKKDIIRLHMIREEYIDNPYSPEILKEADDIKIIIKKQLDEEFRTKYKGLDTRFLFTPLDFFYCFYDREGNLLPANERGFDGIIGNPPYGAYYTEEEASFYKFVYQSFRSGARDVYACFMEMGLSLLKKGGVLSFIVPSAWLGGPEYAGLRKIILTCGVEKVILLPFDVFPDAYVDTAIVSISNIEPGNSHVAHTFVYGKKDALENMSAAENGFRPILQKDWTETTDQKFILDPGAIDLLKNIRSRCLKVFENVIQVKRGVLFDEKILTNESTSDRSYRYFEGDVYRYIINPVIDRWVDFDNEIKERPKEMIWFEKPRILLRRLVNRKMRLMASYTDQIFVTNKNIYSVLEKEIDFNMTAFLGILNSRLISYLYIKQVTQATKDDFPQVTIKDILSLPFPEIKESEQWENLSRLSIRMMCLQEEIKSLLKNEDQPLINQENHIDERKKSLLQEIETVDGQIDMGVFEIYGLNEYEISVINERL